MLPPPTTANRYVVIAPGYAAQRTRSAADADGGDGGEAEGKQGVFDGSKPQTDPVQIALAVDVNGNGKRDAGEPVIIQASEPFQDNGLDGCLLYTSPSPRDS